MLALQNPPSGMLKGLGVYSNDPGNSSVCYGTKAWHGQTCRKSSHDIALCQT